MNNEDKFFEVVDAKVAEYDRAIEVGQSLVDGLKDQRSQILTIRDAMLAVEANMALYEGKIEQYQQEQS